MSLKLRIILAATFGILLIAIGLLYSDYMISQELKARFESATLRSAPCYGIRLRLAS